MVLKNGGKKRKNKAKDRSRVNNTVLISLGVSVIAIVLLSILVLDKSDFELTDAQDDLYDLSGECSLSLCDCKCYKTSELPEVIQGKICGNDCYERMSIQGCELVNNTCQPDPIE